MVTRRRVPAEDATLAPFPEGWYFVATRQAVVKDKLIQKTWMGENVVVWCDDDGRVCVAEAVCPHLGADLGPAAGGCIRGGRLLCPFHGYEFDATGQCVATPIRRAAQDREAASLRDAGGTRPHLRLVGHRRAGAAVEPARGNAGS